MQVFSLGKVAVPTPGTAVTLASALPASFPADHKCAAIIVSPPASNSGKATFGTTAVVASTLVGAIKEFLPTGSTGLKDTFILSDGSNEGNSIRVDDYALDVATGNDGLVFAILVR